MPLWEGEAVNTIPTTSRKPIVNCWKLSQMMSECSRTPDKLAYA